MTGAIAMSLELAIEQNTSAIRELIAALLANKAPQVTEAVTGVVSGITEAEIAESAKPTNAKKEHAEKPQATVGDNGASGTTTSSQSDAATNTGTTEATARVVQYPEVAKAITAYVATHGREATVKLLASFSVKTGKELKPEQYADVLAACSKAGA
jgi:hypothetical protein